MIKDYLSPGTLVSAFALFFIIATSGALLYIFFVERPSMRYTNLPFPVMTKPVFAGDALPLKISRCSYDKKRRVITSARYLENLGDDQEVRVMELLAVIVPPGCVTQVTRVHRVPESTKPGQYRIIGSASVPGLIQDFKVEWYSEPFNVVSRETFIRPLVVPP